MRDFGEVFLIQGPQFTLKVILKVILMVILKVILKVTVFNVLWKVGSFLQALQN